MFFLKEKQKSTFKWPKWDTTIFKQNYKEKSSNLITALKLNNFYFDENDVLTVCGYLKIKEKNCFGTNDFNLLILSEIQYVRLSA